MGSSTRSLYDEREALEGGRVFTVTRFEIISIQKEVQRVENKIGSFGHDRHSPCVHHHHHRISSCAYYTDDAPEHHPSVYLFSTTSLPRLLGLSPRSS